MNPEPVPLVEKFRKVAVVSLGVLLAVGAVGLLAIVAQGVASGSASLEVPRAISCMWHDWLGEASARLRANPQLYSPGTARLISLWPPGLPPALADLLVQLAHPANREAARPAFTTIAGAAEAARRARRVAALPEPWIGPSEPLAPVQHVGAVLAPTGPGWRTEDGPLQPPEGAHRRVPPADFYKSAEASRVPAPESPSGTPMAAAAEDDPHPRSLAPWWDADHLNIGAAFRRGDR